MLLPRDVIDLSQVGTLRLGGRGGQETTIQRLLPSWSRVNHALYDYQRTYQGVPLKLEVKKQRNLQWFDSGKYYRLRAEDRDIRVLFIMHDGDQVIKLIITQLGVFVDWLCAHREGDGWTEEVMGTAARFKESYPSLQFKARAQIATIFRESPELFELLWESESA